jgi:aminoglycoside phosphotransferase (APT) family kinase protein
MQYIEGLKPKTFTDEILEQMAKTLNKIHKTKKTNECVNFVNLLNIAEQNMVKNRLDLDEFVREDKIYEPKQVLEYLRNNKPQVNACLLHGDYRPKNMIVNNKDLYILDWGLSFVGDPYYDLAIIKWYFTDDEFAKFIKYYGIEKLDGERLKYNEWLSAFLNV